MINAEAIDAEYSVKEGYDDQPKNEEEASDNLMSSVLPEINANIL
ncbi:MAG: hypothetical protein PHC39_09905 [Proteiniphilum sp.]|nr:hypothetical protein [Proteiniphilum sp.]